MHGLRGRRTRMAYPTVLRKPSGAGPVGPTRPSDQVDTLPARPDLSSLEVPRIQSFQDRRSSLRRYLVAGDVLALLVTWIPLALVNMGNADGRHLIGAAAAMVSTLVAMQQAGLYRSHVCALHSRQAARAVTSAAIGAGVFAACEWLSGGVTAGVPLAGAQPSAPCSSWPSGGALVGGSKPAAPPVSIFARSCSSARPMTPCRYGTCWPGSRNSATG